MQFMLLLLLANFVCISATTNGETSSSTYFLSYEGVVSPEIVQTFATDDSDATADNDDTTTTIPYTMVTELATELATDVIQLHVISQSKSPDGILPKDYRKLDLDRRCYQNSRGGGEGKCSIDYYQEEKDASIQFQIQFSNAIDSDDIMASIEIVMSSSAKNTRDILIRSIPAMNKQLKCFHDMIWSIWKKNRPSSKTNNMAQYQITVDAHAASLEHLILERSDLNSRMRIATSSNVEVWQYQTPESKYPVRSLFIDGNFQSTTHPSGTAHVEALVHPALLSLSGLENEPHVVILSLEPTAIVREVLKHKRVASITLLGINVDALALTKQYLHIHNDCRFLTNNEPTLCLDNVEIIAMDVKEWLSAQKHDEPRFHAVLVDVPSSGNQDWLDLTMHAHIKSLLYEDAIVVVSSGSTPLTSDNYNEHYELNGRDWLLRQATRQTAGLGYKAAYVYDESMAKPLASSFLIFFPSDESEVLELYLQTNPPAIEIAMVEQMHVMIGGDPPTLVYDGATHGSYQHPSRAWQDWYCQTPPGKDLHACHSFLPHDWYDPTKHHYSTEVRKDPIKGRSLFSLAAIPQGHFVLPDDAATALWIDPRRWELLNDFSQDFPDATMYRQLRDFVVAYGFESDHMGWAVSLGSNATFINHACQNADQNVMYVDKVFESEDDDQLVRFSPFMVRFGELVGVLTHAIRDIAAEEEILMDYTVFRSDDKEVGIHNDMLHRICNSGGAGGMVESSSDASDKEEL